jgi:transposase
MKSKQYRGEFKSEAVKQVIEKGYAVVDVAKRLGVSTKSLYVWVNKARASGAMPGNQDQALRAENIRLKAELKRTTEERDILKKAATYFAKVSG